MLWRKKDRVTSGVGARLARVAGKPSLEGAIEPRGCEGTRGGKVRRKGIPGREKGKCKGPELGLCLVC